MPRLGEGRPASGGVRALLALVIGLGILIVAGLLVVMVTLVHRTLASRRWPAVAPEPAAIEQALDQPPGTRIVSIAAGIDGDWLAILVAGGGLPDRVLVVDPRRGRLLDAIRLSAAAPSAVPH